MLATRRVAELPHAKLHRPIDLVVTGSVCFATHPEVTKLGLHQIGTMSGAGHPIGHDLCDRGLPSRNIFTRFAVVIACRWHTLTQGGTVRACVREKVVGRHVCRMHSRSILQLSIPIHGTHCWIADPTADRTGPAVSVDTGLQITLKIGNATGCVTLNCNCWCCCCRCLCCRGCC